MRALGLLACVSAAAGCAGPGVALSRPTVAVKDVARAVGYEKELSRRYASRPPIGAAYFEVLKGGSHVLVLAPHATLPNREGKHLFADGGTGSLARCLHDLADATVVSTTYAQPSDPNYDDDNDFKRAVAALLATGQYSLVLDIHGSHANQVYDVDFGTMHGESVNGNSRILRDLVASMREQGILNLSHDFFPAAKQQTDTKWAHAHGVAGVQLEINSTWLIMARDGVVRDEAGLQTHRFAQMLQAIANFIKRWDGGEPAARGRSTGG